MTVCNFYKLSVQFYLDIILNRKRDEMEFPLSENTPKVFKALADPVRREILELLRKGRLTVGEIVDQFDLTGATISYHLSQLLKAGLIVEEKQKNFIYYELNASVFEEVLLWLMQFRQEERDD